MAETKLKRLRTSLLEHRRNYSLAAAWLAAVLVLIFAPRMEGPRYLFGIRFTTKAGTPGLTDLGWVLLIVVPLVTYFAVSGLLWWMKYRIPKER